MNLGNLCGMRSRRFVLTAGIILAAALYGSPGHADQGSADKLSGLFASDNLRKRMFGVESCVGVLGNGEGALSSLADCAADQVFSKMSNYALNLVEQHGKKQFGEHFHIDRRLGLVASTGTLSAELDVVLPLSALSSVEGNTTTRSFFVQNGVTRWRDARGFQRSDVRLGAVHRHALFEEPGDGVIGASMFVQENLERGHARLVTGVEYLDRWGQGSLTYYMPTTDWQPGHHGYEERAIAGAEFAYSADLTTTVHLRAAAGRWESRDGSGGWAERGRLGLGWQPHPWFELHGGWEDIGTADDSMAMHVSVTVPLGGGVWPREGWQGLGRREAGTQALRTGAIWDSVSHVGRIEVVEREASTTSEVDSLETFAGVNLSDHMPAGH